MEEKQEDQKEDIIIALKALQIISWVIIITLLGTVIFPIGAWVLIPSILLLFIYSWDLEKRIKKKEQENEQHKR